MLALWGRRSIEKAEQHQPDLGVGHRRLCIDRTRQPDARDVDGIPVWHGA